jgi:hypothetical protein
VNSYDEGEQTDNAGRGVLSLYFVQSGSQITGTWGTVTGALVNVGTLTGNLSGNMLTANLISTVAFQGINPCPLTLTGTVLGISYSGTLSSAACSSPQSGTFSTSVTSAPQTLSPNAQGSVIGGDGSGTIPATLTENGVTVIGPYATSLTTGIGASGQMDGVLYASNIYFDFLPSAPGSCLFTGNAGIPVPGDNVIATYSAQACAQPDSGIATFNPF